MKIISRDVLYKNFDSGYAFVIMNAGVFWKIAREMNVLFRVGSLIAMRDYVRLVVSK